MQAVCLHSKQDIAEFFQRNPFLHLYAIGDLDDFFWPYTIWYALKNQQEITQIALLYTGTPLPTLLGLSEQPLDGMRALLEDIKHLLPRGFYAHLSGDLVAALAQDYNARSLGVHYKMALLDEAPLQRVDSSRVIPLSMADQAELEAFYRASYPDNSFDPRMLATGRYYAIRQGNSLASVAGIHVYSPHYRVATLGNVTTHPQHRGKGLATAVCAKLCQALLTSVDHVGLNVKADNLSAIACYERLGFERSATYEEYVCELR